MRYPIRYYFGIGCRSGGTLISNSHARFHVGQQVQHLLFNYRGLIYDVDALFSGTDEWYEQMARSKPPKDAPWYHVLVHGADHVTYVAEQNLEPYGGKDYIDHPHLDAHFKGFKDGIYQSKRSLN